MNENDEPYAPWPPPEYAEIFRPAKVPPEVVMAEFACHDLPSLLEAATVPRPGKKTTSKRAAQELCYAAVYCLEHGLQMPAALQDYIVNGLRAGIEGRSVDAALRLKRGTGQSKAGDPMFVEDREHRIAVRIFGLWRDLRSLAQAKEHACAEFKLDTRRIEQIWNKYGPPPNADAACTAWQNDFFTLMNNIPKGGQRLIKNGMKPCRIISSG